MKLGMNIMAPGAHLNSIFHKSLPSVCVCMCIPHIVATQRLSKHVPAAMNTRNNRRTVGCIVFNAAFVIPKESLWVCLCISSLFPGNSSVNTFLWQQRIVGGVGFHAVCVISKESRQPALSRNSCYLTRPTICLHSMPWLCIGLWRYPKYLDFDIKGTKRSQYHVLVTLTLVKSSLTTKDMRLGWPQSHLGYSGGQNTFWYHCWRSNHGQQSQNIQ
jgi:hypothetical protein